MLLNTMFTQNDIIETGMQASLVRNDVILNNIANVDTPNFKKSNVKFENILADVLDHRKRQGAGAKPELSRAVPVIEVQNANFSHRLDGNNVNIETEMVDFYENSVRYDVMASAVMNNYKKINMVLTTR